MRKLSLLVVMLLGAAGLLQARSIEYMRNSAGNIDIHGLSKDGDRFRQTISPERVNGVEVHKATATAQQEIKPAQNLVEAIVNLLKLLFAPNGDIEIAAAPAEIPGVEEVLADDESEEDYREDNTYQPLNAEEYGDQSFFQQPRQAGAEGAKSGAAVPADLKRKALEYFASNQGRIGNKRFIGIVDFSRHSSNSRFWILDVQTGAEHAMHVAHGKGSDTDGDGYATRFSNVPNSKASSLGFYVTGALYSGKHGRSMRLHGLSSTNSNALSRAVVVHESSYVREANVTQGRSFGCFAVAESEIGKVLSSLKGGALIYAGLGNSAF